ncbi:FG-GAP repeat domain-containing protein [Streptomyces tanashiensis]|uniref:FG-GAP repeat domain-containing protein n=1 Tax=Streptomyces tanashiensis TaxID=67367 RepID=UPI0036C3D83D
MDAVRTPRRRLVTAVTTVLALTLGAGALTVPATAAGPSAAAAEAGAQAVVPFPRGGTVAAAGRTGFLTLTGDGQGISQVWHAYAGGTTTSFGNLRVVRPSFASDVLSLRGPNSLDLLDTVSGRQVSVALPSGATAFSGSVGWNVFARAGAGMSLVTVAADGTSTTRTVSGLPALSGKAYVVAGTASHGLLRYQTSAGKGQVWNWALVDLATAAVTEKRQVGPAPENWDGELAVSAARVAWVEGSSLLVVERGTGKAPQRIPLSSSENISLGLVGDWVTYAQRDGLDAVRTDPLYALTARNLRTGATRKVLEHLTSSAVDPAGALLARGGTVTNGEGLYRVAPGTDGVPAATLVATTGEPTKVTLLGSDVPATVSPRASDGRIPLAWSLSRTNVDLTVTLRHTKTGVTKRHDVTPGYDDGPHLVRFTWSGDVARNGDPAMPSGAPAGAYTWRIDARPRNGIGPTLTKTGSFTLVRRTAPHDFAGSNNGSPDVISRDAKGRLRFGELIPSEDFPGSFFEHEGSLVGSGWGAYDKIEATGNLGGSGAGDLVARDRSGVLWLYKGRGDGTLAARGRIGGGWGTYNRLAGGSDLTGDGRPDLVATDASGALWLYKGTGVDTAPFAARRKIGTGWSGYNDIVATGDLAGGPAGDLLARDASGTLWLHLGKGDGTLAARTKVGSGWNTYTHLVGVGDVDRDGRPDLYAAGPGGTAFLHRGTGAWSAPFRPRAEIGVLREYGNAYDHFA